MINSTPIETLLAKLEDARAKATQGQWTPYECGSRRYDKSDNLCGINPMGGFDYSHDECHHPLESGDAQFMCVSANTAPALIEAFREVLGALDATRHFAAKSGIPYLYEQAIEALARANEIASEVLRNE